MKNGHTNLLSPISGKVIRVIMRVYIVLFCTVAFGFVYERGFPQNATIVVDTDTIVTATDALKLLQRQTDYIFNYRADKIKELPKVPLQKGTIKAGELLTKILSPGNFTYEELPGKRILIKEKENDANPGIPAPTSNAPPNSPELQQLRVTGTVTDPNGNPLPGVNIIVKGTSRGTMSDPDGNYNIRVMGTDVLTFSFVGFRTVEQAVEGQENIDVEMEEDVTALAEVEVNAGYYTVKDRERTGNISRITAEDIEKQPVANPLQALQGRMPGVYIQQTTGVPGGGFNIQIRGQNSLRNVPEDNGNLPLYIVDGVPYPSESVLSGVADPIIPQGSPLNAIDPNDIKSIEILKDADATAIYGSRGANGVVLITTKKGKVGKGKVDINVYSGIGKVSNRMDLLNTEQYLEMRNEAIANEGATPSVSDYDVNGTWDQNRYTDWQKELIGGTAQTTNVQATLSGGNTNTQFMFRGGYYKETTVYPGDMGFERFSGLLNVNHASENRKFRATISNNFSSQKSNMITLDYTSTTVQLAPNAPTLYDENGELNWENSTWANPLAELEKKYEGNTINLVTSANLSYELLRGLRLKTNLGYNYMQVKETRIFPVKARNPAFRTGRTGSTSFGDQLVKTWIVEPQVDYEKKIGEGVLNILAGVTFQETIREGETLSASGYTSDALLLNKQAATDIRVTGSNYTQYRYNAVYGRINYNWKEKYIVNMTGRRDGSTRFGPGKQFGNFGAVGAAWIFSNESFIRKGLSLLSFGKLRTSYGVTGSDNIGNYQFLNTYSSTIYPYAGSSGLLITRLPNDDFSWETVKKFEAGLELGLLKDQVLLGVSWYRNRSSDQLVGFPLPVITGASSVQANFPATVENKGWEFSLSTLNINSDNLKWRTSINLTVPRNKLIDYPNIESSPFATRYAVGKSLYIQRSYHFTGVDPETGINTFEDVNGDGNISFPNDIQFLREITQDYYGGIQNSISYKGLEVDFLFQFVKQTGLTYINGFTIPGFMTNQPTVVLDRWQQLGDQSEIQRFTQSFGSNAGQAYNNSRNYGDNRIGNASFIRLKNVSLSYSFPENILEQLKLESLRLYVQGQNLWTITNYIGFDPETQSMSSLPTLRTIVAGIQFTF
ncbi:SusC/RagA family TonB-linked outer membrane protein [Sinomicrobium sp. M5D2P17]